MINITLTPNGYYEVRFNYRPYLVDMIKQIDGSRFYGDRKCWTVPASKRAALDSFVIRVGKREDIVWGGNSDSEKHFNPYAKKQEAPFAAPELPDLTSWDGLKIEPYPFQKKGIARGLELKNFINGDEPGLGKTFQSIGTVFLANAFPCLVVCPSGIKENWKREWAKFAGMKAMILEDNIKNTWQQFYAMMNIQVFIVNYESLKKYFVRRIAKAERWTLKDVEFSDKINLFQSIIIDECHRVKSTSTQQSKFCKGIASGASMQYRIGLTGTPVVNKPKDLISQLGILSAINLMGGYKNFVNLYCAGPNEASNLSELNRQLWDKCFFRREKSKVLPDLPEKMRQTLICEITNRKEYDDAERDIIRYLLEYKQADDEKIMRAVRGKVMVQIGILMNISARGKLREVVEFVKDFRENGQKLVLFCSLHEVVDTLKRHFPHAVSVTGRENSEEKQRAIDSFQNNSKTDLIICSIRAAGVGLTLTAASNVAFVEFPWTYADCCQCEDRCHRIGQKNNVTAHYFLGKKTIDEKVYKIIQLKKQISNAVMGATDTIEENIVDMISDLFSGKSAQDSECDEF